MGYWPQWLGYFRASYKISDHYRGAVFGHYVDQMESGLDPGSPPDGRWGEPVGSYFDQGINLRGETLVYPGIFFNAHLTNLLNTEIRYPTTTNSTWAPQGTLGSGRAFLLTLGWKF